jgi:hypothetical protein
VANRKECADICLRVLCLRAAQERYHRAPAIADWIFSITSPSRRTGARRGLDEHLTKPVTLAQLERVLAQ